MCCCLCYAFLLFLLFERFLGDAFCFVDCFLRVVDVFLFLCVFRHAWHVCVI